MIPSKLKLNGVKKIAVLRAGALGDFIVTLPALFSLRNTYPDAEMVLFGRPWQKEFARGRTPVDRVIVVPVMQHIREENGAQENKAEVAAFFEQMRSEEFDVAVNFQGSGRYSNLFIKQLEAGFTVGPASEESVKPDRYVNYFYYQNEMLRFVEVAGQIGCQPDLLEPRLGILPEDREEVADLLQLLAGRAFIVINPCAKDIRRMWPLENYGPLAAELIQRGYEIIFTGAADDRKAVDDIIHRYGSNAMNLCGVTSLGGLAALIAEASVFIGPDTGPLHLARAVNTPTVGMYWAPNLINWGPLLRNIHVPLISWDLQCPFCGILPNNPYPFEPKNNCEHAVSFVRGITVQEVLDAVENILANKGAAYSISVAQ